MSFADCIREGLVGAQKKGFVTEKQAKDLTREYDELVNKYKDTLGEGYAEKAASDFIDRKQQIVIAENEANVRHAVFQNKLQGEIENKLKLDEQNYNAMNKAQKKVNRAPSAHHVVGDLYQDIMTRQNSISKRMMVRMVDFFDEHASRMAGFTQKTEQIPNVVRAVLGERTPNDMANQFGDTIRSVFDDLHEMYRQAGGIIGKVPNYFPQVHNPVKLKNVDFKTWRDEILPRLDRENMIDYDTGLPMDDARLLEQMKGDYEAITTNGLSEAALRLEEGLKTTGRGGDVFKRKQQSRFYRFKSADDFLEYNEAFGLGNEGLYEAIMGQVSTMSRDIALMQKLGPKPNAMARYFDFTMEAKGVGQNSRRFVNGMYDLVSGRLGDYGTLPFAYRFIEGTKALTRFFLGGAAVSALPDSVFVRQALKMNGFNEIKAMKRYFNGVNPASPVNQRAMQRFTTVMQSVQGNSLQAARFIDDITTDGGKVVQTINFLSGAIIRASGLTKLTDQGRMSVMAGIMGEFDEFKLNKTPFGQINPEIKNTMARYGMGKKDYDIILKAESFTEDATNAGFITAQNILSVEGIPRETLVDVATKYDDMVTAIAEIAVNEPTLRTRAATTGAAIGDARTGSALRATVSSLSSFKSFPITVLQNFVLPLTRRAASGKRADVLNLAETLALTTIIGGAVYQAKSIQRGETARDMDDPKFWFAAAMQGGGLGLFGDFLFDDYSRYGHSLAQSLAGPVVSTYGDATKVVFGNFQKALDDGTESNFANDAWRFSSKFIPGKTLWYARLPIERVMINGVDQLLDPNYKKRINAREKRLKKTQGQKYWWKPGNLLPN